MMNLEVMLAASWNLDYLLSYLLFFFFFLQVSPSLLQGTLCLARLCLFFFLGSAFELPST